MAGDDLAANIDTMFIAVDASVVATGNDPFFADNDTSDRESWTG
ncbi:seryl-tRNA synthetase [Alicyclobacillus hesperidum URH17-3-68]|nr:seryl-tRNA synthetase [Alicyclobacillus hesperidum URH17-3-68]